MTSSATTRVHVPGRDTPFVFGDPTAWVLEPADTLVLLAEEDDGTERCVARFSVWTRLVIDRG